MDLFSFGDALEMALGSASVKTQSEIMMIDDVLGRVLAVDIVCRKNLPSFDNSAMDGFAFRYVDVGKKVDIVSTIFAGDTPAEALVEQSCYKIMTGAKVPSDADTIVPIEDCIEVSDDFVVLPKGIKKGSALRKKGEELREGSVMFGAGEILTPAHIALLSAQGIVALEVYTRLSIAVVSTGDEIKEPWDSSSDDEIYNANAFGITAELKKFGFVPTYVGSIPDDLAKSIEFISKLSPYDVIITTGGVSMGDADFLEEAFVSNGLEVLFHGVNVKPGRPTMMGVMNESFVMAMPGNPLTAMLNIFLLTIPVLFKMQGVTKYHHSFVYAKNVRAFRANPKRANIVLGAMIDGEFHVTRDNRYGSGMLTPMYESSAVAVLGEGVDGAKEDEMIKVVLFDSAVSSMKNNTINGEKR
ncbi:MAG TPA: molybdopterin molybdenumtransferase MoeA [Sulfurovum sp.]|nr:molybdopterin molybdenumtransferase MoeA [Sulfurovum sp.]